LLSSLIGTDLGIFDPFLSVVYPSLQYMFNEMGIRPKHPGPSNAYPIPSNPAYAVVSLENGGTRQLGKTLPYLCPERVGELTRTWLARTFVQVLGIEIPEIGLEWINYAEFEPCKKWRVLSKSLAVLKRRWNAQPNCSKNVMSSSCAKCAN
jgi:hypothetical protein